jgi:hypothetical protein
MSRDILDRDDDTIQPTTPVFLRFRPFRARKKAQFLTVILDPGGFNAFSKIGPVVDSKIDLTIYSRVIPIRLLAIKA